MLTLEALRAVIFDVDGTLVDSNELHAQAWQRAFVAHGFRIGVADVLPVIGKGGDKLVPTLVPGVSEDVQKQLAETSGRELTALLRSRGLQPLPGATIIWKVLRERNIRAAIASSAKRKDFALIDELSGLRLADQVEVVVLGDEVEESKPEPDIVAVAAQKLGVAPGDAVMVGDTPYDMEAAHRAGVTGVGVLTGAHGPAALRASGATFVFPSVKEFAAALAR